VQENWKMFQCTHYDHESIVKKHIHFVLMFYVKSNDNLLIHITDDAHFVILTFINVIANQFTRHKFVVL